jgi:hypothetical protein
VHHRQLSFPGLVLLVLDLLKDWLLSLVLEKQWQNKSLLHL